ncbi:MAG: L-threonylcarbamoyladenylate synthase [Candidatus Roizmanbacteria bacterium]|nr:L-threonylcarbamoyladenylate synthase [Candidatus Roizmanbacteria bacterium]
MIKIKISKKNINLTINQAIKTLQSGGLVIFPSDTVYGLLVDATNKAAVEKLIAFKNRPVGKPISVFTGLGSMGQLVEINNDQQKVFEEILPGPFTIILPSKHKVNKLLESETGTLGVRIPMYRYIEVLVDQFRKPITATSANLAGRSPHYSIGSLLNELTEKQKKLIDLIVDAGQLPKNKPSTVVDLSRSNVKILRQGNEDFIKSKVFRSLTSEETKNIAGQIFTKNYKKDDKPLIFIIKGEMGVGKTVFVKGIGEKLGINNIVSPTYVIYYEYKNFYHFDLYQIEDREEFGNLGIDKFLVPGNILCFEWGEKAGEIIELLKDKGNIVYIDMKYINEKEREIIVQN